MKEYFYRYGTMRFTVWRGKDVVYKKGIPSQTSKDIYLALKKIASATEKVRLNDAQIDFLKKWNNIRITRKNKDEFYKEFYDVF